MKGFKAVLAVGVVLVSVGAQAAPIEMGAWFIDKTDKSQLLFAGTADARGNVLAQYRSPRSGNCIWGLVLDSRCEAGGGASVVLATSNIATVSVELRCDDGSRGPGGHYHYTFTNFGAIDDVVKRARRVEFSIPLERGGFSVVGFDLRRFFLEGEGRCKPSYGFPPSCANAAIAQRSLSRYPTRAFYAPGRNRRAFKGLACA